MLNICATQLRVSGSLSDNLSRASILISDAAAKGANLVVLPEIFTGTYGVQHFADHREAIGLAGGSELLRNSAAQNGCFVVGGVVEESSTSPNTLYNTTVAYNPRGEEVARYRKIHLSKVSVGDDATSEATTFTPGASRSAFTATDGAGNDFQVGLACCFDLRFQEHADKLRRKEGADVIVYSAAWLNSTGMLGHWELMLRARALDNQVFCVGSNHAHDSEGETVMYGHSMITSPWGNVVSRAEDPTKDEGVFATVTRMELADVRERINLTEQRRPECCECKRRCRCWKLMLL